MPSHAGRCVSAMLFGLAACGPDLPEDLGDHPWDRVRLVDVPALSHFARATQDGLVLTVEELYRRRPAYTSAPDPTLHFEAMARAHRALPTPTASTPLRVLSYNLALLDRWYPFAVVASPEVDRRRARAPEILLGDGWDILLLQEVWDLRDVDALRAEAEARGYVLYAGSDGGHEEHGLVVLVHRDRFDPSGPDERREATYAFQRDIEDFPGPGIARGYLSWRFRDRASGRTLFVFATHASAFPELAHVRETQVRELGLATHAAAPDDLVIVGGDLNGAPYYPVDVFGEVDGEPVRDWWRNAQAYALMLHYGALQDAMVALHGARDVQWMQQLPAYDASFRDEPLGDRTRCLQFAGAFTATDCNRVYFEQYAGTEFPARIDHVLWRDPLEAVRVTAAALHYEGLLPGETFELSDHAGVGVTFAVGHSP